ncbi:hypothetical protein GPA10_24445 [Streptomyces sp. p1417]|uniref:Uncharacterized protein n=1 Tax=Streptomyces typhae TaxID=2681492 RepID=A0A6L6X1Y3_9ACTN|nr:hypothetical protein [Streptomyces typhae]MVO87823.1 hypothetical protein [Streptomyces typhae]
MRGYETGELIWSRPKEHLSPQRVEREAGLTAGQVKTGADFLRRLLGPEDRPAGPGDR